MDAPAPEDVTLDAFLGGRLRLAQPARGFRSGSDAVLLAAAVPARPGQAVLELGCGAGAAILCLGARVPGLALAGLEIQPAYAALARENAARNGLALEVVLGDVAAPPAALDGALGSADGTPLGARPFDAVLMNPPWHDRAASTRAADPGRDLAHGGATPIAAWVGLAARRLRPGGRLMALVRTAALPALLAALPPVLGSPEVLPLASRAGAAPHTAILRARKGGRAPFRLLAPLALHEGEGDAFAPAVRAALRDGAALPWDPAPVR